MESIVGATSILHEETDERYQPLITSRFTYLPGYNKDIHIYLIIPY